MLHLRKKHRYSFLLLVFFFLMLAVPIASNYFDHKLVFFVVLYLAFFTAIFSVADELRYFKTVIALTILLCVLHLSTFFYPHKWLFILNYAFNIAFCCYLSALIFHDVMVLRKTITFDTIAGSLNVYILIGLLFANIYSLLQLIDENSFTGVKFISSDPTACHRGFMYFSFVTLTTLGYGDMSPNTLMAGAFASCEAILGQIFMAVMVARLVGIHTTQTLQ